ncbi:ICMT-domain-containing protein [Mycena polygramma]|nr:ICMT-domain-containing protein [Mycena polygramma]
MSAALFKSLLLVVLFIAHHYTTSPPIAPPGPNDRVFSWQFFDRCSRIVGVVSQVFVAASFACEILLAASSAYPSKIHLGPNTFSILCPHPSDLVAIELMSPMYIFALVLSFAGSAGRIWCYTALGRFFTYEVTLRPAHTLITRGLYRWVRHPGYISLFTHLAGMIVLHMAPGGWNHECGIMGTRYAWFVGAWIAVVLFSVASLSRRGKVEDLILKDEFGEKWERYSAAVPYSFIPGLL